MFPCMGSISAAISSLDELVSYICAVLLFATLSAGAQESQSSSPPDVSLRVHTVTSITPPATKTLSSESKHLSNELGQNIAIQLPSAEGRIQPATVTLDNGMLTVVANNAELTRVLQRVADLCGMTISGLDKSRRIFGVYGPGYPRDILRDLLVGSGYNFIMVGGAIDGIPRALLLTYPTTNTAASSQVNSPPTPFTGHGNAAQPEEEVAAPDLGPGAIPPAPSQNDQDDNIRVRQTMDRLQHMQEQQTAPK